MTPRSIAPWFAIVATGFVFACSGASSDGSDVDAEETGIETGGPDGNGANTSEAPDPQGPEPDANAAVPGTPTPATSTPDTSESSEPEAEMEAPGSDEPASGGGPGESEGEDPAAPTPASGGASFSEPTDSAGGQGGAAGSGGTAGATTDVEAVSFTQVEQEVFEPAGCTAGYCHGGGAGDMVWSYEELVGMEAAEAVCGLTERVVPGDPGASILWQRVRPRAPDETESCAEPMPMGGQPLNAEQAQLVYDWIASGAAP